MDQMHEIDLDLNDLRNIYSATVSFYRGLLQSIRTCCAASF